MIEANLEFLNQVIGMRTSASAAEGEYVSSVVNMKKTMLQAGRTFSGLPGSDKSALIAKENDFVANYAIHAANVDTVFAAAVPVEFDTDGMTIVNV